MEYDMAITITDMIYLILKDEQYAVLKDVCIVNMNFNKKIENLRIDSFYMSYSFRKYINENKINVEFINCSLSERVSGNKSSYIKFTNCECME